MKILISGGCGFIGHHFVEHFLKLTDWKIIIFDMLSYAANGMERVRDINAFDSKRVEFYSVDLTRPISVGIIKECSDVDYISHLAANTHVDNSIIDPMSFVYANVVGTGNILEFARKCKNLKAFHYAGTDEQFGPAPVGVEYKEWDRYNSGNPYSASKCGAMELTLSYMNTYNLPGFATHLMNCFGERQHPEKFIPLCIRKILAGEKIFIHGTADKTKSGSRFYIHARNVAATIHFLLENFTQRDKYNIVGEKELTNLELAQMIADILGKPLNYEIVDFHSSRPGHDLRYALDGDKLKKMGYNMPITIDQALRKTVEWTLDNVKWLYI